eukprot:c3623_g1_i1 orf=37-684(+)
MVCLKADMHTNIGPAVGFHSFDKLSREGDNKPLGGKAFAAAGLMSSVCSYTRSTNMGTDASNLFVDSTSLSCLDMLSIEGGSKTESGTLGVVGLKGTVLVEDTLIMNEHCRPELSIDAITSSGNALSWQQESNDTQLQCNNYSGFEELSIADALAYMRHMTEVPSIENFVCVVQKCRKISSFVHAKQVHLHLCKYGLEAHKDLGNFLVPMFVECG